jgi:hypothetical protein
VHVCACASVCRGQALLPRASADAVRVVVDYPTSFAASFDQVASCPPGPLCATRAWRMRSFLYLPYFLSSSSVEMVLGRSRTYTCNNVSFRAARSHEEITGCGVVWCDVSRGCSSSCGALQEAASRG